MTPPVYEVYEKYVNIAKRMHQMFPNHPLTLEQWIARVAARHAVAAVLRAGDIVARMREAVDEYAPD